MIDLKEYALKGKTVDVFVFDVHGHIGEWKACYGDGSPERLVGEMDRVGVNVICVSGIRMSSNEEIKEAVEKYPDRIIGYCRVAANYPEDMEKELEKCFKTHCFKGIKVHCDAENYAYDGERFIPVWEYANRNKLPVLAHTWGKQCLVFEKIAPKYPDVKFIMAHSGSDYDGEAYIKVAKANKNVYLDLALSLNYNCLVERLVENVGLEKILYGSDTVLFSIGHQISKVLCARLSFEEKKAILGENACKIFGINPDDYAEDEKGERRKMT